jgi:hypothetical protein
VRAWLKKEGFQEGDLRSAHGSKYPYMHPMGRACYEGELNVCEWLHAHGAAPDITKANKYGTTPMYVACLKGHLSVCKWLLEVGAAADITKAGNDGTTTMKIACQEGHLSVCEWLFKVGAAADITKAKKSGATPMRVAFHHDHSAICHWLVLNGALSNPDADSDHVDPAIVTRDLLPADKRPALLAWAQEAVAASLSFRSTIVMGTFYPEGLSTAELLRRTLVAASNEAHADTVLKYVDEIQQAQLLQELRPVPALTLLRCQAGALELIADFLGGVLRERELRNAREFVDCAVTGTFLPF